MYIFIMTFAPQKHDVVVLLDVQLRGEDEWLRVKIACPLGHSNRTQLFPVDGWSRETSLGRFGKFNNAALLQRYQGNATPKGRFGWTAAGPAFPAVGASHWAAATMSVLLRASTG